MFKTFSIYTDIETKNLFVFLDRNNMQMLSHIRELLSMVLPVIDLSDCINLSGFTEDIKNQLASAVGVYDNTVKSLYARERILNRLSIDFYARGSNLCVVMGFVEHSTFPNYPQFNKVH